MPTVFVQNDRNSRFTVTHLPTGETVVTDPSASHGGGSSSFEPTDLVDAALLACTGTMIYLKAVAVGIEANGIKLTSSHTMANAPRRIAAIDVAIEIPFAADENQKRRLIAAAKGCPVRNSLSADMAVKMSFKWADGQIDVVEK